jgi:hypothetical protein
MADPITGALKVVTGTKEEIVKGAKIGISIIGGLAAAWYINKKFKEVRKQNFVNKNAHLPDVQVAMIMRKAMFRIEFDSFPFNLIAIPDGTNEALLYKLAKQVSSLEAVIKAYSILFESNLPLDVYSELSDNELIKFYESLSSKGNYESQFNSNGSPKPQTPLRLGQKIVVSNPKGATVYKTEERNGRLYQINETRAFVKFGEDVGTITNIYRGTNGAYYYAVDMNDWYFLPDTIFGYGWVAHTEVKGKD